MPEAPTASLARTLVAGRNADGGWGYYAGKASRLEPTSLALIALGRQSERLEVLQHWPSADGLLLERSGGEANFGFHGIALIALRTLQIEHAEGTAALISGLQKVKGVSLDDSPFQQQDNKLQGWSWTANTFSWVEPTAWCLLALKKWSKAVHVDSERIQVAERLLIDRCCSGGGWNYGNSNVRGQQLKAFVPTTAIALLSMQDKTSVPAVTQSLHFLEEHATTERSGVALALALLALATFGRPWEAVRTALEEQVPTTLAFGNHMSMALALGALQRGSGDAAVRL